MKLKKVFFIVIFLTGNLLLKAQDKKLVYVFLSETCPICKSATIELNNLNLEFSKQGFEFIGVFPNENVSTEASRKTFSKKYKIDFKLISDTNQKITKQFNATITPEVIVWNESKQKILYRGKIDNSFESVGKRRTVTTAFYLRSALESIQKDISESITFTEPVGCFIQTKYVKHDK
jgi:peroxiredoxin